MSEIQTTTLGRNWLIKTLLFLVLLLGFGCWGLVDAVYFYPRRGEMDAARRLKDHLAAADAAGMLTSNQLKVTDPKATYAQLRAREAEIARLAAGRLSNRQIAEHLVVSERTVENHLYRIFIKLAVTGRDDLATALAGVADDND